MGCATMDMVECFIDMLHRMEGSWKSVFSALREFRTYNSASHGPASTNMPTEPSCESSRAMSIVIHMKYVSLEDVEIRVRQVREDRRCFSQAT
jgi:hypothetical protein